MAMTQPLIDLLNKVEAPKKIMLFTMPLRAIRIVAVDEEFKTFHVEQLVLTNKNMHSPRGSWQLLSTHGNPISGRAWGVALEAALEAQTTLRAKLARKRDAGKPKLLVPA